MAMHEEWGQSLGLLNARRPGCRIPGRPKSHTATVTRGCDRVGMKKPGPSRAGWYDAIMQRALRAVNSPSCVGPCHHGVGFWTPAAGSGSWQARKSAAVSWYPEVFTDEMSVQIFWERGRAHWEA